MSAIVYMNRKYLFLVIILLVFQYRCTKKLHPEQTDLIITPPTLMTSNLNLPVKISRYELNRVINKVVTNSFNDGFTFEEDYKIQTRISGPLDIQTINNALLYSIPLQIEISPKGFLSKLKAKAEIEIQLSTSIDIFQDQLLNKTELVSHRWINKPILNIVGISLPIEQISNFLLKKYKSVICTAIDETIQKNVKLDKIKNSVRKYFNKALYSTEDSIIHIFASPQEIALGPMSMTATELVIPCMIYFESVVAETRPVELENEISFSIRPFFDNNSTFDIQSRIPLPYIEQMVRESIENQQFGSGISQLTVKKIHMEGANQTMIIHLELAGAYKGKMDLFFDPVYQLESKSIVLEHLKLKPVSGLKMDKIIFSLVKGIAQNKLKQAIEEQINLSLIDYVNQVQQMIHNTEVIPGLFLEGDLTHYEIKDIKFVNFRMYFNIHSILKIGANIKTIDDQLLIR